MSPQAWVLGIVYLILLFGLAIASIVNKAFTPGTFLSLLVSIGFVALLTYDTACLTKGDCSVWSWIRTIFYIIIPVIIILFLVYGLLTGKREPKEAPSQTVTVPAPAPGTIVTFPVATKVVTQESA